MSELNLPSNTNVGGSQVLTEANHANVGNPHPQYVSSQFGYKKIKETDTVGMYAPVFEIKINTNDTYTLQRFIIYGLDNNAGRPIEVGEFIVKVGVQGKLGEGIRNASARIIEARNFNPTLLKILITQDDTRAFIVKGFLKHDVSWIGYRVHVLNNYFSDAIVTYYDNADLIDSLPSGIEIMLESPTFLQRYGDDTKEGNLNFNTWKGIYHQGQPTFTNSGTTTIISGISDTGSIILRPKGQNATDVQVELQPDGCFVPTAQYPHIGVQTKPWKNGYFSGFVQFGVVTSATRPASGVPDGATLFDSTIKKLITYYGGKWYADGVEV